MTNPAAVPSQPVPEEPGHLTPSQTEDINNPKQSTRFRMLSKDEQQILVRAHKNLGHPSPERFSTMLRSQGFRSEMAQAALEFQCSVCNSQRNPKIARPSTIRDELDFNDRICTDGLSWTNRSGTTFHMYHVVDWATSFQAACSAPDRSSQAVIQYLNHMWLSWAGSPCEMIVDAATEFNSDDFQAYWDEPGSC